MPDYQADRDTPDVPCETYQTRIEGEDWLGLKEPRDRNAEAWLRMPALYVADLEAWA